MRLNDRPKITDRGARLDQRNSQIQCLTRSLNKPDIVRVSKSPWANVVRLVQVGVVALVVDGDVEVDDVAVEEDALVGDAVADDLVGGSAEGLGEFVVVERGGV